MASLRFGVRAKRYKGVDGFVLSGPRVNIFVQRRETAVRIRTLLQEKDDGATRDRAEEIDNKISKLILDESLSDNKRRSTMPRETKDARKRSLKSFIDTTLKTYGTAGKALEEAEESAPDVFERVGLPLTVDELYASDRTDMSRKLTVHEQRTLLALWRSIEAINRDVYEDGTDARTVLREAIDDYRTLLADRDFFETALKHPLVALSWFFAYDYDELMCAFDEDDEDDEDDEVGGSDE